MTQFEVQPDQLAQTGARLDELAATVHALQAALAPAAQPAATGFQIEGALTQSLTELRSSLTTLATALADHGAALASAATAYARTDANAARAATRTAEGS